MNLPHQIHRGRGTRLLACALALLLPLSCVLGQSTGAILYSGKNVRVNGRLATHTQAVQSGDEVQTASDGASMIGRGNRVVLHPNTIAKLEPRQLDLTCGTAMVRTIENFTTKVQKYTIAPQTKTAQYQVSRGAGKIVVASIQNVIEVSDGSTGFSVSPGGSRTLPDPDGAAQCQYPPVTTLPNPMSTATAIGWWTVPAGLASAVAILGTNPPEASPTKP